MCIRDAFNPALLFVCMCMCMCMCMCVLVAVFSLLGLSHGALINIL